MLCKKSCVLSRPTYPRDELRRLLSSLDASTNAERETLPIRLRTDGRIPCDERLVLALVLIWIYVCQFPDLLYLTIVIVECDFYVDSFAIFSNSELRTIVNG